MNYENIIVLAPEGSGSMYLWRLINSYFSKNLNGEFKLLDHSKLKFPKNKSIYHVSFPSGRNPQLWLKPNQLPNVKNKVIFIVRNNINSIYSNYRRFFVSPLGETKAAVKAAVDSHFKGVDYMEKFKNELKFETLTITYESLMKCTHQTLHLISNYLELDNNLWEIPLKINVPVDKNDFRFLKDKKFMMNFPV